LFENCELKIENFVSMHPTASQYAEALEALSEEGTSAEIIARNFLGFLKRRGESDRLAAVVEQLDKRGAVQSGTLSVTIVTAHEPGAETKAWLVKQAERIFSGKTIKVRYAIDDAVVGGARFQTDEILYDVTVGAELRALRKAIYIHES
jgi:F0F1-type ATP synthase delta subunit